MKIAQIVCAYPPYKGGIGNVALKHAEILFNQGHEITTFTPGYKNEKNNENVIRLRSWLKYGKGAFLPQLFFILKNFDIIYLHYPFFGTAEIVWLFKIFHPGKKLIIHYHMDVTGLSLSAKILSIPNRLIRNSLFKKADIITCASLDYIKNSEIAIIYKKYISKFKEIPFGVDINKFTPRNIPTPNKGGVLNILFVGGLDKAHYFKGVDILLKSAAKLKTKNWQLLIVGNGELKIQYQKQAQGLRIHDKVKFLENIKSDELPRIYQEADLFVLPSINKNEAFGLVLLESMASGVPVIASNLPGVRSVFQNGIHGFLTKPGNSDDLRNKIELILKDKNLRKKMSQTSRKLAEERYGWEKIDKRLNRIFVNS
ncbi:MAG: glycosyltransferase family 4 protein [Patescibacteria group bacterium]